MLILKYTKVNTTTLKYVVLHGILTFELLAYYIDVL